MVGTYSTHRNAYEILIGKPARKKPMRKHGNNIKSEKAWYIILSLK